MVLDYVPDHSSLLIKGTPVLDPDLFCHCYLHMVNKMSIPERLENAVAEAKKQDILHSIFSQVMVNPVNLFFIKSL
jgi:hypothetical protein